MSSFIATTGSGNAGDFLLDALSRFGEHGYDAADVALVDFKGLVNCMPAPQMRPPPGSAQETKSGSKTGLGLAYVNQIAKGAIGSADRKTIGRVGRVFVAHSGLLDLRTGQQTWLSKYGAERNKRTESEIIAYHLNHALENGQSAHGALRRVLGFLEGAFAFAAVVRGEPNLVIAAKKGAPLLVGADSHAFYLASEPVALAGYVDHVWSIEDGDHLVVRRHKIDARDASGREISRGLVQLPGQSLNIAAK